MRAQITERNGQNLVIDALPKESAWAF